MAKITEKMGLNYDLNGSELDYFTKLDENWKKIDAFLPLCVIDQIALASLPVTPSDGDIYLVDDSKIYIRQSGAWDIFDLPCGISFYDQSSDNFYKFDGTTIFLDTGTDGVLDASNVGGQIEIYKNKVSGILNFKTLLAGSGITIDDSDPNFLEIISNVGGFASGTKIAFFQATAPVAWTLDASVNDRFVRISSSSGGGTGGTFSNLSHSHTSNNSLTSSINTGTMSDDDSSISADVYYVRDNDGVTKNDHHFAVDNGIDNREGQHIHDMPSLSHNHTINAQTISHGSAQHAYINAIICSKD